MQIYLVGGAVRDKLLGRPVLERDYVVVGATEAEILNLGFKKVGRDFPVFLHPRTHEEYALARTERKVARGYTGFVCHADPQVTLEEDLKRRDLTINALAESAEGGLIDPYGGFKDLQQRVLRHVSPAFVEDPVRILRVARFAARFGDFTVADETQELMRKMVSNGEIDALVAERVWHELERALSEAYPEQFFTVLQAANALSKLFPEIAAHLDELIPILRQIVKLSAERLIRFGVLATCLEKTELANFCRRYRLPRNYSELAGAVAKLKAEAANLLTSSDRPQSLVRFLEAVDSYRRPERLQSIVTAYHAYALTRNGAESSLGELLLSAYEYTKAVRLSQAVIEQGPADNLRLILHQQRVNACRASWGRPVT